ncbi:MAG: hypothetical protein QW815_09690, partial [Nitrososphaerota archaeon]
MAGIDESLASFLNGIQEYIRERIVLCPFPLEKLRVVCGVDVSYGQREGLAVAVNWSLKGQKILEVAEHRAEPAFP